MDDSRTLLPVLGKVHKVKDKDKTKEQLTEELEKLRQELQLYEMIVEKMPLALTVWKLEDLDDPGSFRLIACNAQIEKATDAPYREFVGTTVRETFPSLLETEGPHIYAEAVRTGQVQELPDLHFPGDEETAASIYSATVVPLGDRLVAIFAENITERKWAEEELIRLSNAVKMSTDSIVISDLEAKIIDVNEATLKMYGTDDKEDLIGKSSLDLITPEDKERAFVGMQETLEKGYIKSREYRIITKDGSRIPVEMSAALMKDADSQPIGFMSVSRDITERKRAERLLQALNQAAVAMEQTLTPEEIFTAVAEELKKLGFSCAVLLTDESQKRLFPKYFSYGAGAIKAAEKLVDLKAEGFSIPVETVDVYRKIVRERKPILVKDSEEVVRQLLPKPANRLATQIARMLKVSKSIDAPLIAEDEVIGLLLVQSDDLTEGDIPAITAFAHQMAAAWRKATLLQDLERSLTERVRAEEELQRSFEKLQRAFEGTVNALVSAIEMRDPYTAGHQRRVTQLACAIAKEMGLPAEQIEGIRMAGLIHDIGKINVPAEILSKPAPLTELEYGLIKMHPRVGHDILRMIEFPWPVAQIVLQHHERMDGSGYPQGLSGEKIILEARILGVADVVEAMSSYRPYRPALSIYEALGEISQNRGILYDPEAVDACLELFTQKGFEVE
jgi:PAS domain S-box-containing protein/putative nucleotidyltransferase with HDIG domain